MLLFQRVTFIINPIAGRVRTGAIVADAARRLESLGVRVCRLRTRHAGHAVELARQASAESDLVVAVGGDGTVREVVEGCVNRPAAVAVLPAGTENIVARHLGAAADADALWAAMTQGRVRPVDVGFVNGRPFLIVVGAGFDAEVVRRLTRVRRGHITRADYFWPIWNTFWQYRFWPVRVIADGQMVFDDRGLVFVGNVARYGAGLRILRDARDDDGWLDLCVYPCRWHGRLILHSVLTAVGRHVEHGGLIYRKVRRVRIESPRPVPLQADGDCAGTLPAEVTVLPAAVRFCVPPAAPSL